MRRDKRIPRTLQVAAAFEGERYGHVAGDIVRFRGDGSPLRALTLGIDPVQDLHGYDSPWPAGGGKNLLPLKDGTYPILGTGVTATVNNSVISFSGTASSGGGRTAKLSDDFTLKAGTYFIKTNSNVEAIIYINNAGTQAAINTGDNSTFTLAEDTLVYAGVNVVSGNDYTGKTATPMLNVGNTAESYAPYSNICPISGWTGVNVYGTGANVFDGVLEEGHILVSNGNNAPSTTNYRSKNYIPVRPNTTYYLKNDSHAVSSDVVARLFYYGLNKSFLSSPSGISQSRTFTTPDNCYFIRFFVNEAIGNKTGDISINYPSTDHDYHAYQGTTYPITIPTPPGTVYGGYISVGADGSAELVVDRAEVDLGDLSWTERWVGTSLRTLSNSAETVPYKLSQDARMIAEDYEYKGKTSNAAGDLGNPDAVGASLWSYYYPSGTARSLYCVCGLNDTPSGKLVYPLATPITIPLSDITISTLAGQNVMWGDCGAVDVEYVADNGVEGGKLALLLRNRPELLIAMRKGGSPQELLLAMGSRGDARPGITPLKPLEEKKDEDEEAMRK